jgi:hypothetical protein
MSVTSNRLFNFIDGAFVLVLKIVFRRPCPLQPIFVERAIEKAIAENTMVFKDGVLPPNTIKVLMNDEDYGEYRNIEEIYTSRLLTTAHTFIENEFKGQAIRTSKLVITVEATNDLTRSNVKVVVEHHEAAYERVQI